MNTKFYNLTKPQKSIWLTEEYFKNTAINNVCGTLTINQEINKELLEKAILLFISSNDSLKLKLDLSQEEPKQYICNEVKYNIKYVEINNETELNEVSLQFTNEQFNLDNSFLFDFIIFKYTNKPKGGFIAKLHHLISDAWSMSILIDQIIDIYNNLLSNIPFTPLFSNYLDYIKDEQDYLNSDKYYKNKEFWNNIFNTPIELTTLSKKQSIFNGLNFSNETNTINKKKAINRSVISSTSAKRKVFTLSEKEADNIKEFCKIYKTSPFTLFMAILGVYTGKINNTNNVIIGTPILNRKNFKEKHTMGMFISTIPFKININFESNFVDFLSAVGKNQLSYFKNQRYPYDDLLKDIRDKYNITNNLYTTVLSYQNAKDNRKTSNISYNTVWNFNGNISEELEIHISDLDDNDTFDFIFDYNISKFNENEIIELKNRLFYIIKQVLDNPQIILKNIETITPDEKNVFLTTLNNTHKNYPQYKSVLEIFYDNVIKYPDQTAVVYENETITYKNLYKKVCAIENELLKNKVTFQEIVAIYMPKSVNYVASILAVLKLGAIYLPISYDYPLNRINYMLENSKTKLVISNNYNANKIKNNYINIIYTDELLEDNVNIVPPKHFDITNSAYIIYTSGSTGEPKGVEVSQKSLINHVYGIYERFDKDISYNDATLSIANTSFDANVEEIFIPLFFGATLHLVSDDSIYDPRKLANYIANSGITFTFIPPTILNEVYNNLKNLDNLKLNKLLVGVQSIKNVMLNKYLKLLPNLKIHNGYGPTEATICCISRMYNEIIDNETFYVPIGKPMNNCEVYLLNNTLTLQPFGYVGEICIGGDCLSKGYLYNKEKTEKSFIYCENINKTIYRTGDYGYYLPNGEISYVGRIDNQIKLNGFRIELSEIDEIIYKFSNNIENSISLVYDKKIYTFLVASDVDHISLKQYLKINLPYYMLPVKFINIEKIPSTKNGKLDKEYLINILKTVILNENKTIIPPTNKTEKSLVKIYSKVLEIPRNEISIKDNFFEIGGDSLSAIKVSASVQKKLGKDLPIKKLFDLNTLQDIAKYIDENNSDLRYTITTSQKKRLNNKFNINIKNNLNKTTDKYPISSAQKRIYLSSQMSKEEKLLYNMPGIISLPNNIDVKRLESALNKLIATHESLRTFFIKDATGIYQKILPSATIKIKEEYINKDDFEDYVKQFPKEFDLSKAPLLRCKIANVDNNEKFLLIDIHHIISDGVSTSILINDLSNLYNGNTISKAETTYAEYSLWEKKAINNNLFNIEKEYWKKALANTETLNLPTDFPKTTVSNYKGSKYQNLINENLLKKIKEFCKKQNITLYMYLMGSFNILMHNFCRQENITIGTPIANRHLDKITEIIGMFVNTLAIHTEVKPSLSIEEYFSSLKTKFISSFDNQIYPYDELTNDLKNKNLINTMFTYQNAGIPKLNFDNFETTIKPIFTNISKFDLSVEITPIKNYLEIVFEYSTNLFKLSTIESLFETYVSILTYIVDNEDIKIGDIDLISLDKRENILYNFNNTASLYPKSTDIYSLFLEQVEKTPDNMAIFFEGTSLTYKELNEKICALSYSMKNNGISKNDIVAILIDKSIEAVIAMFATLKLGAAFLPIDIEYPTERIDYMLTDSKAKILLTTNNFVNKTTIVIRTLNISLNNNVIYNDAVSVTNITSSQDETNIIDTESPSHIIYTSGSTGKPKGTIIKQKGVLRLVKNTNYLNIKSDDKMLHAGSIGFDASTFEIFGALLNGLPLYIIKKENLLNSSNFQDFILKNKITLMLLTPSLLNQLCEINPHIFNGVRTLLTGGDVLSPKHINMLKAANPNLTIINAYGPTENTTISSTFTIDKSYKYSIPIGKPIANSTCYIVSNSNKLLPVGFPGELWVGGDGVALGYLNNPTLTLEKFIQNPFGLGTIYKTGDLAKWLPDGNIEFMGRIDSQVKIRGFRIELKEIDVKLATYLNIKEAYSLVNNIHNEKCICTYIVSDVDIDLKELQNFLKSSLPKYMVPKYIVQLKQLPLNTNGKVDKHKLPSPIKNDNRKCIKPTNKTEEILLKIFEKILNKTNISTTDDFFEIGGDSLGAMKIQIEALSEGIKIEYSDIFVHSTIKDLANLINKKDISVNSTDKIDKKELSNISTVNEEKYLSYNTFLKNNNINNIKDLKYETLGNILLTGFTGFLGAHILDSFIKKEKGIIYCLIRDKDNIPALQRLKNTLNFYFDDKYDKYIGNRIQLINGDIANEDLGLNPKDYITLGNNITTVIHSAALVKHYGTFKEFEKINILGTKHIVDFCNKFNLKMMHISTISVSGNILAEDANVKHNFTEDKYYDETNFYIGQNIENLYVNSKFKSEDIVLSAISNGLKAYIIRMGNLTSRFSEGKFQQNHFENAFVNRIKSILDIGYAPEYLLNGYVEFTPIDFCGNAIIDLATHYNKNYSVFHLLNDNHVPMQRLLEEMQKMNIPIQIVSSNDFKDIINNLLKDENKKEYLQGIINDFDENQELAYESNIKIKSEFTKEFLKEIGFNWPYINTTYLKNYFKYLSDIGYFNIKI